LNLLLPDYRERALNVGAPIQALLGFGAEDVVDAASSVKVPGSRKTSPCPRPKGTTTLTMNQ
jgi:hypothetical protein